ncbi:hypothetical protein P1S61_02380 [Streptomyces sp. ME08-AFT2]|uniref:hypothetical protein n=1 Tax=Streptomyces sp. ME08-AFT2 TaxID=3028683 RepID=UPI0029B007C9|nr:hypothetical protein [Streptomyces sp. ME08-AFT2]MDX3307970.1 hypothetical protein [Streptomyces sp. ME08-AFT2]
MIAALALATGCSGEQSLSEQYPTQWKTCNALLGTGNMESLREIVDSDDLRFSRRSLPVEQIQKGLTREAIEPYDEYKGFDEYEVCGLSGDGQFKAMAMWAADNLRAVQADTELWHRGRGRLRSQHLLRSRRRQPSFSLRHQGGGRAAEAGADRDQDHHAR